MKTEPVAVSIVLSDLVICQQGTGKNSLIGCFNNYNFPVFQRPTPLFHNGFIIKPRHVNKGL